MAGRATHSSASARKANTPSAGNQKDVDSDLMADSSDSLFDLSESEYHIKNPTSAERTKAPLKKQHIKQVLTNTTSEKDKDQKYFDSDFMTDLSDSESHIKNPTSAKRPKGQFSDGHI